MKKIFLLQFLIFVTSYTYGQWQEITQYGLVKDFLYIDSNLQYIWGDTNYIVENGQARMVADFGFNKKNGDIWTPDQADFVKGTRVGYKIKCKAVPTGYEVFKTTDGGISWKKYAESTLDTYYSLWMIPIAINSETVYIEGRGYLLTPVPGDYPLPLIKVFKNNKIDIVYPKVYYNSEWRLAVGYILQLYFFDKQYGLGYISPYSHIKTGIVRTIDGGNNFTFLDSVNNLSASRTVPITKKYLYSINAYNITYSNDSGFNWTWIKRNKNINLQTDTSFSGLSATEDNIFYLKGNIYFQPLQTVSYLFYKKLINQDFDSVEVKPVKYIECYDNERCYMYGNHFYINNNANNYPLNNEFKITNHNDNPKVFYIADQNTIFIMSGDNGKNENFRLRLLDISGKLLSDGETYGYDGKFSYKLKESLPQGIYIVNIVSVAKTYSFKFFKY